jgi:hypothetical protein
LIKVPGQGIDTLCQISNLCFDRKLRSLVCCCIFLILTAKTF